MLKFIHQVELLFRFQKRFGRLQGFKIYVYFLLNNTKNITIPDAKFPFHLRPLTSDIPTFYQVYLNNEYDFYYKGNPKVIIDGGANIGLFAIRMKNRFPDAKIICIEPDAENFMILCENVSKYENIFCENSGLWHQNAKLKVYDKYDFGKWGVIVEEDTASGNIDAVTIDYIINKYNIEYIDILKLDIEGSEQQLFSNNYEKWLPIVRTMVIELHDWMKEGCAQSFFAAISKIFSSYKFSTIGENIVISNKDLP